jgi:hypothetical protein
MNNCVAAFLTIHPSSFFNLSIKYYGIMGPMSYIVNKIITKIEDHKEEKDRARERRRSFTPSPLPSQSLKPRRELRKRGRSYDERHSRHTDPNSSEVKFKLAGYEFQAKKASNGQSSRHDRNSRSEGNLADSGQSRDIIIDPGDRGRGRNVSPRKSDSVLSRLRSSSRGGSSRSNGNNRLPGRSMSNKRHQPSNGHQEIIRPMPPPQWTEEARKNAPLALRANNRSGEQLPHTPVPVRNLQAEEYQRLQRQAAKKMTQKRDVDWDRLRREKNEEVRLGTGNNKRKSAGKETTQKRERENAEEKKREAVEKEAIRQHAWEEAEKKRKKREAIEREAACQREWEKSQKRQEAEEAEKKADADSLWAVELNRREAARRANEERRLAVFGSIGESNSSKTNLASPRQSDDGPRGRAGGSEQQQRPPAWPNGVSPALGQTASSRLQRKPLERRDTQPVPRTPALGKSGQQNNGQRYLHPFRSNSNPITPQKAGNRGQQRNITQKNDSPGNKAGQPRRKLPAVALLTEENLRAQRGNFVEQAPVSELNRGLGDNTRTFIEGFAVPTELQSKMGDDEEEIPGDCGGR